MKKKRVCILTATRAEWGLLRPLAQKIKEASSLELVLAVTGTHFCASYGNTYQEILRDGFSIDERVDIQLFPESPAAISKTMGLALMGFGDLFDRCPVDLLVVLGDRYETIAVCLAACNAHVPIAHIHGGETTEGAIDEGIRHAITKLSHLHFAACEDYRRRIIQLGEQPDCVFNVGALAIDNMKSIPLMSLEQLSQDLEFDLQSAPYGVVTFHPVTLEENTAKEQCLQLFQALLNHPDYRYLITKSNADLGGGQINRLIDAFAEKYPHRVKAVSSLGARRYLSALKYARVAIGNSSSGLTEAPAMGVPTVNIGDRQKGRLRPESVIDCAVSEKAIERALSQADEMKENGFMEKMKLPFGDGHAAESMVKIMTHALEKGICLKKKFYDINVSGREE